MFAETPVMPASHEILSNLRLISHEVAWLSAIWHAVAAITIVVLLAGFRPKRRTAAASLSMPLASVSIVALASENPFNGAVFAALSILLAGLAFGASTATATLGSPWALILGSLLIAFGWIYPHFLEPSHWFAYLYSAPMGTIPCPTLSAVVGAALVADGFGARAWRLTLAISALLYSAMGIFRLGVAIDALLLLGAFGLIGQHLQDRIRQARHREVPVPSRSESSTGVSVPARQRESAVQSR
jgi:hypothetical protein